MKIKTKVFSGFLKKAKMSGKQGVEECALKFEKDGLKINANSPPKLSRVMAWLKKDAFKEYEELGAVCINDMSNVIKVLERFDEFISIKKEGNLLTVSGDNKKVEIELIDENFIEGDTGEPKIEFDDVFNITSTQLAGIISDVNLNKDSELIITTEAKKVKFNNTGKYKFENFIEANTCKGGVKVKMGEPFIESIANLDSNLELNVKTDFPIKVVEKTDISVISIIVAPRIDDNK